MTPIGEYGSASGGEEGGGKAYLSDCVQTVARSSRRPGLRSSDTAACVKPTCRTKFGESGFCYAGPAAWNNLPLFRTTFTKSMTLWSF